MEALVATRKSQGGVDDDGSDDAVAEAEKVKTVPARQARMMAWAMTMTWNRPVP